MFTVDALISPADVTFSVRHSNRNNGLVLNQDAFSAARNGLSTNADSLQALRDELSKSLDNLRSDWNSEAGKAFFAVVDEKLDYNLNRFAIALKQMSELLRIAEGKYAEVFSAATNMAESLL